MKKQRKIEKPLEKPVEKPVISTRRVKPSLKPVKPRLTQKDIDDVVYKYIIKNKGVISISKARKELKLTDNELNIAFNRLKEQGKIK